MRLILVRHGETDWNKARRYQGHTDLELNDIGVWQAERLRERLAEDGIDVVCSSDLRRALATAQVIASNRGLKVIPCKSLREIDFGEFEGMTFEEIQSRYPDWVPTNFDFSAHQGESLDELASRVGSFISNLAEGYSDEKTVLVVSHGGTLRIMLCLLIGISTERWWQIRLDSASITIIEGKVGEAVLRLLNDTCHLEDEGI